MAEKIENILGEKIEEGVVNCNSRNYKTKKVKVVKAGHPIPNEEGIKGVESMINLTKNYSLTKKDLIICLVSGGGSSLMTYPFEGIKLGELREVNNLLIECGAEIEEINLVRKSLSRIKGGKLNEFFYPARIVSLIISDIVAGGIESVASGPTVFSNYSTLDALAVLEKYNLENKVSANIINFLKGFSGEEKSNKKISVKNYVIGDNKIALNKAKEKAKELGFNPFIISSNQKGETSKIAKLRAEEIKKGKYKNYNLLLIGGETTPCLPQNHGNGGRNQHYVAVSLKELIDYKKKWLVASFSTDGVDYSLPVAGAIADNFSAEQIKQKRIKIESYLSKYNTNDLFKIIDGSFIETGNTGTNVGDIMIYVI
jgi:hydroxypyruvate reductase/glycerate 2-kinase